MEIELKCSENEKRDRIVIDEKGKGKCCGGWDMMVRAYY
jgi:hypothetical protein